MLIKKFTRVKLFKITRVKLNNSILLIAKTLKMDVS
jgi:hypothetical protein